MKPLLCLILRSIDKDIYKIKNPHLILKYQRPNASSLCASPRRKRAVLRWYRDGPAVIRPRKCLCQNHGRHVVAFGRRNFGVMHALRIQAVLDNIRRQLNQVRIRFCHRRFFGGTTCTRSFAPQTRLGAHNTGICSAPRQRHCVQDPAPVHGGEVIFDALGDTQRDLLACSSARHKIEAVFTRAGHRA